MKKEKIFSLLNIKDYNNELEKILAKKNFSMDTKNLLLTMSYNLLYLIEKKSSLS